LEKRVNTISLIHEKLYLSENISKIKLKDYIHEINKNVFSMSPICIKIEENIEDLSLTTKSAIPLGLIINEIATNTLKHGFTDKESASFIIEMREDRGKNQYMLKISNNGKPIPEKVTLENPNTLGMQLISAFVKQLEGTIEMRKEPSPVFTICFPVEGNV
jgi:two-component sensor histidine kinase